MTERLTADEIADKLLDAITPRCEKCGAKLPPYPYYTDKYEVRHCLKCYESNYKKRISVRRVE